MLATLLENKVRGGQWHTLIDKVFSKLNLFCSAGKVLGKKGAAGVDRQTVEDFAEHEREELQRLHEQLRDGTYRPAVVRRTWTPETGVPQGAVLSPVLSNVYLNPLDHRMAELGFQMVRYADDFVILCRTPEEAEAALAEVRRWVEEAGLTLHPEKTHIVDSREKSFSFLGYSFRGRFRFPRAKSHQKVVARIRQLTPRKSGESLDVIIRRLNRTLRGWFNYFRHCFWKVFKAYDGMIRRRLRRLLLKRHRRNRKRLPRNQRWPNAYFTEHGYVSLAELHVRFVQSIGTY